MQSAQTEPKTFAEMITPDHSSETMGVYEPKIDTVESQTDTTEKKTPVRYNTETIRKPDGRRESDYKPRRTRKFGLYSYKLHNIRESVLVTTNIEPERPYSQNELTVMDNLFFKDMGLSKKFVFHTGCGHSYYLKSKGERLKKLQASVSNAENEEERMCFENVGNCSVCWKGNRTPRELETSALDFIKLYETYFPDLLEAPFTRKSFRGVMIQRVFYIWLYNEQYETTDYKTKNRNRYSR